MVSLIASFGTPGILILIVLGICIVGTAVIAEVKNLKRLVRIVGRALMASLTLTLISLTQSSHSDWPWVLVSSARSAPALASPPRGIVAAVVLPLHQFMEANRPGLLCFRRRVGKDGRHTVRRARHCRERWSGWTVIGASPKRETKSAHQRESERFFEHHLTPDLSPRRHSNSIPDESWRDSE